jgi:hypothetical protein
LMLHRIFKKSYTQWSIFNIINFSCLLKNILKWNWHLKMWRLGVVAHAYNSSYLGGRDWEDYGSRQTQ